MQRSVASLLKRKGFEVWSVKPKDTVLFAIKLMAHRGIGAVLVVDDEKLVGILSERDYTRKVILQGRASQDTPVAEIMSDSVITVSPHDTVDSCMALMTEKHIRHLPVIDGKVIAGVISIGDVVKSVLAAHTEMIDHLERYITS